MRQSSKTGTLKITNPQSSRLAGFTDTTLEDASAWTTADGVKQDRGWAYADGSTLDNTSGRYNSYLARTGSLVLPNGPFRTKEVDNSVLAIGITGGTLDTLYDAVAVAYTDNSGNWRLLFNISGLVDPADNAFEIDITGITFKNTPNFFQAVTSASGSSSAFSRAMAIPNENSIAFEQSISTAFWRVSGDVVLESKPTWADANLEAYPVVQLFDSTASGALGLPEATADVSGTVDLNQVTEAGRNYIINGGFDFWQRGTSHSTEGYGSADRMRLGLSGGTCTVSRQAFTSNQTDVPGFPEYFLRFDATSGNDSLRLDTRLEDLRNFAGKTWTLSFWAKGTNPGGGSHYTTLNAKYGAAGTNFVFTSNEYQVSASWQKFTFTFNVPDLDGTALDNTSCLTVSLINQYVDNSTNAYQIDIAQVKLEEGTVATKFTRAGGTYAGELALCQRYYEKWSNLDTAPDVAAGNDLIYSQAIGVSVSTALAGVSFSVKKRTTPTVVIYDHAGTANSCTDMSSNVVHGSVSSVDASETRIRSFSSGASIPTGENVRFNWTADAEL